MTNLKLLTPHWKQLRSLAYLNGLNVYLFDFTSSDVITGFTSSDQTRFWTEMGLGLGLGLAREILIK